MIYQKSTSSTTDSSGVFSATSPSYKRSSNIEHKISRMSQINSENFETKSLDSSKSYSLDLMDQMEDGRASTVTLGKNFLRYI